MTKGIRAFAISTFNASLATLPEVGAIAFRREVMAQVIMAFEISVASAATHYNHALKLAKAADPTLALGRAPDKKGGRKPKVVVIDMPVEATTTPAAVEAALEAGAMPAEAALAEAVTA